MLDKFSEELRNARENKNITLQQMAAKTRIDVKFLEALDNGNFSFLPELYVKAFIRQYAKVVDLDEEECVKKYELARKGISYDSDEKNIDDPEPVVKEEKNKQEEQKRSTEQTNKKVTTFTDASAVRTSQTSSKPNNASITIVISVIGVFAVAAAIYFLIIKKSDTIIVEEKPYERVLEQQNNQRFIEEPKEEEPAVISKVDSLTIEFSNIDSTDSAWILVIYDENSKGDFLLFPKSSKKIKAAKNIKCTLGNSGVVRIKLNNNLVQFDGKKGSVRHFLIDENGIERLYSPPTLARE